MQPRAISVWLIRQLLRHSAFTLVMVCGLVSLREEAGAETNLPTHLDRLVSSVTQIRSLHYRASITSTFSRELVQQGGNPGLDGKEQEGFTNQYIYVSYWAEGERYVIEFDEYTPGEGQSGYRTGFDGQYFHLLIKNRGRAFLTYSKSEPKINPFLSSVAGMNIFFAPFDFLLKESETQPGRGLKLGDLQSAGYWATTLARAEVIGETSREGRACLVMRIPDGFLMGRRYVTHVFFARELGYYPVAYERIEDGGSKLAVHEVTKTAVFEDAENGTWILYPEKTKSFLYDKAGKPMRVTEGAITFLQINKPIDKAIFSPPFSVADHIYDSDAKIFSPPPMRQSSDAESTNHPPQDRNSLSPTQEAR